MCDSDDIVTHTRAARTRQTDKGRPGLTDSHGDDVPGSATVYPSPSLHVATLPPSPR